MSGPAIDRRRFIELVGGGLVILIGLGGSRSFAQDSQHLYPEDVNAFLSIGCDGRVTVFSGKIEMGQGVMTSLAQMVADELGVSLASIEMIMGDTDRCPVDLGTFGSMSTRFFGPALRAAAARARRTLMELAAAKLGVPSGSLTVKDGVVEVAMNPARRVSYGELSRGARITDLVDRSAVLRAAQEFKIIGRSAQRLDARDKVTGTAKYAADIRVPGMLYACLLRPATHDAKLQTLDTADAEALPGVTLIKRGELIAVLHSDPEAADKALSAIKVQWQRPSTGLDPDSIRGHLVEQSAPLQTLASRGDLASGRAATAKVLEASYEKGYVAHCPIEPHAALARIEDGKATIWASTQTPFPTRDQIADAIGFDRKDVRVITPYVGGGFGGKSASAQAIEAARLAQIVGRPVQVAWTRAEEFFYDSFDPAGVVKIGSGLGTDGRISFFDLAVYSAGERGAIPCYDIANLQVRSTGGLFHGAVTAAVSLHPFAVGPWRAPGANMNVFAIESQIDAMAAAAREDPLAFRLRNLSDARMRRVLQAAAARFGWTPAVAPSGRGLGIACNIDAGTYVAAIAEVKVDAASGHVQVMRVVCAQDMGIVVNPDGATMQIEGGITMGLGLALSEELRFQGGDVLDRNFGTYEIPRFSWVPKIDCVLIKNDDLAPQGGGEPPITMSGAVVANAVFDATGARMLRLPMSAARIKAAIAASSPLG